MKEKNEKEGNLLPGNCTIRAAKDTIRAREDF